MQRGLFILVLFGTAVALLIALALTRYIARPIVEIDAAIRQLGGADFSRAIAVRGPEDLRYLGRRLDWLRRRLEEFETQKNRFLRHVSHELKTPLTALREGAELLHDQVAGPLAPPQRRVVSIMRDNSIKLQRLIEELLDYQRALHAAASLEVKTVVLDALVTEAAREHELAARAKGLTLEVDAQASSLEADPDKLRSVVDNLISNAVKFTPPGGRIVVRARVASGEAVIEVLDSGPGVPVEERESIFKLFFKGRTKSDGGVKSSGLGLAIARELVEAHGGHIAVVPEGAGDPRRPLPRHPAAPFGACPGRRRVTTVGKNYTFKIARIPRESETTNERRESQGPAGRRRQGPAAADRDAADGGGLRGDRGGVGRAGARQPGGGAPAGGGHRPAHGRHGRHGAVRRDPSRFAVDAGGDPHRARHHSRGGRGDAPRRLLVPHQAVRAQGAARHGGRSDAPFQPHASARPRSGAPS